ncbi:MoxR family ATPase [Rubrivirga sp. S365]|uniref:MoxR family ATPase n=1 Tax=Rubrivirga litoralis TaxID=3075598 RepID=A0ABU3BMC2_9BACT|nr:MULTISPECIES: MoxR family ATPase [unclassified Rubrivirga]MDT0630415.1 MoxR family ATPase [Rubrivirga sp. F394]MDT7857606.1 MoxR family ATPase [Rubrivirga sp. S365]
MTPTDPDARPAPLDTPPDAPPAEGGAAPATPPRVAPPNGTGGVVDDLTPQTDLGPLADAVDRLRAEVGKLIVGQGAFVDEVVAAILAGGHVLIEGVPGVAKTLTAKLVARASGLDYSRIQFTPDLMPADVLGTSVFSPKSGEFSFHRGPIFAQVVLIDEINRAPAKTQAALFETMEERQATVDGTTYPMPSPFVVLATQNPIEHEGTYRLPEAQLDRFLFKVLVGYPSLDEEAEILRQFQDHGGRVDLERVRPVLTADEVEAARAAVRAVRVAPPVLRYAAEIVAATRSHPALSLGASPRASLALVTGAKAVAAMSGRDFATPDDVAAVAAPALRHRVLLTPEREIEGVRPETVLQRIVAEVEVPR